MIWKSKRMNSFILVLYFSFATIFDVTYPFTMSSQDDRKCKLTKVERKLKARCHGMNLRDVPQFLTTGIEILDLSFNRLRKLKRTSFEKYAGVQYLVLYDNMIQSIEPDTFTYLRDLQEIDLSNNALTTIPLEIFQLPHLRNLYVDDNSLINLSNDLKYLEKPIRAPLEYINVAKCELEQIPDLGILPNLWHINASMNPLTLTTPMQFLSMCHLKTVDLTDTTIPYCSCQAILNYLKSLGVKRYDFDCDKTLDHKNVKLCPEVTNSTIDSEEFQNCNKAIVMMSTQKAWMYGGGTAAVVIIFLLCCLCCILRSRKRKPKENKKIRREENLISENFS